MGCTLALLGIVNVIAVQAMMRNDSALLTISFLDVGQGDAVFIESPTGRQVLVDGGPNRDVLRELAQVMPWYDRSIDVVIATHPDADHVTGLVDVLQRYRVSLIVEPGVASDTPQAESMLRAVADEDARYLYARRGQVIDIGGGAYLEILFPDRDPTGLETNTASVVTRLVYGETAFMLTGDAPDEIEHYLVRLDGEELRSDVLKAGHHGSRTSSSLLFVGMVDPESAVYSRGCDNTYGHPHEEVQATFAQLGIKTLDTCAEGTITFVSDGLSVVRE